MSLFINNNNDIIVCASDKIIVFHQSNGNTREVEIPTLNIPHNLTKNHEDALKNEKAVIVTCNFSKCEKYFAVSTLNKQLVVYDSDFNVVHNLNVARTASKVRFTSSGDLLVADKSGDVYLYKLTSEKCETTQVLGHLSMVLDVLTNDSEKYIITCDRDEKIRVSQFPGSYNIVSFCLGHEEFVLGLEFYSPDILISASGDGTVRFWNYILGKQLAVINANECINDKSLVHKFAAHMDSETVEVTSLPITNMKVRLMDNYVLIVISLHCSNSLQVYHASGNINVKLLQVIDFDSKLFSFDLADRLCVLTESKIHCYKYNNIFSEINCDKVNKFYDSIKDSVKSSGLTENISVLYKRKYDNVQEYQERKKLRIENKNKS